MERDPLQRSRKTPAGSGEGVSPGTVTHRYRWAHSSSPANRATCRAERARRCPGGHSKTEREPLLGRERRKGLERGRVGWASRVNWRGEPWCGWSEQGREARTCQPGASGRPGGHQREQDLGRSGVGLDGTETGKWVGGEAGLLALGRNHRASQEKRGVSAWCRGEPRPREPQSCQPMTLTPGLSWVAPGSRAGLMFAPEPRGETFRALSIPDWLSVGLGNKPQC